MLSTFASVCRGALLVLSVLFASACASAPAGTPPAMAAGARLTSAPQTVDRQVVRSGRQVITVEDPEVAASLAQQLVVQRGGWVESLSTPAEGAATLSCRVPAERLDEVMDALGNLGDVQERTLDAVDVTDQLSDMQALLDSKLALRDRFRALLERAQTVEETLGVERELARLQAEVDSLQGRLERTRSQVADSALSVRLEPERVLGPLGWVGHWIYWGVSKLFVIS